MDEATGKRWIERAVKSVANIFPSGFRYENRAHCERLLAQAARAEQHIESENLSFPEAGLLLKNYVGYLQLIAQYAAAEPLYLRALEIYEKALGPEHPQVAATLNNLAFLSRAQGRYADAEPLYERALAITEKALGPEHPDVAVILENYADLLKKTGRHAEAEKLAERARNIRSKNGHNP
jgi:tetratricopeptide (TPR) repeat protein